MCSAGFDLSLSSFAPLHDGFGGFMQKKKRDRACILLDCIAT